MQRRSFLITTALSGVGAASSIKAAQSASGNVENVLTSLNGIKLSHAVKDAGASYLDYR